MGPRFVLLSALCLAGLAGCKKSTEKLPNGVPVSSCDDCTFLGKAGVCYSREFEAARTALADPEFGDGLKNARTQCVESEVCLLCDDPQTGEPTGACNLKPLACPDKPGVTVSTCENPVGYSPLETMKACGEKAHCLPYAYIDDEELASRVNACENDPTYACVPDMVIQTAGRVTFRPCTTLGNAEGRCLPSSLPDIAEDLESLPQDVCAPDERCSPCYDPVTGEDLGACRMGCDTGPVLPVTTFASCAGGAGRCVEDASLDEDAENFEQRDCPAEKRCVPYRIITDEYVNCVGTNPQDDNYMGTCLNTDLLIIDQSDRLEDQNFCQNRLGPGHRCVPCWQGGNPTDAPGCPESPASYTPDRIID
jgi:hypothetical protein